MFINTKRVSSAIRLGRIAFKKQGGRLTLVGFLGLVSGLFGAVGITTLIPLFSLLTNQQIAATDFISRIIARFFEITGTPLTPFYLMGLALILFVLKAAIQLTARYLNAQTVSYFEEDVRRSLLKKTFGADWPYLINRKIGYLENIIVYDVERGASILSLAANLLLSSSNLFVYAFVAFAISPAVTWITIISGVALFFIFKSFYSRSRKITAQAAKLNKSISHDIGENLIGSKTIKTSALENEVAENSNLSFVILRNIKIGAALLRQTLISFNEPLGFLLIALIFLFSYQKPAFSIASFAVVIYLIQKMFGFIQAIQTQIHMIYESLPYLSSVLNYQALAQQNQEDTSGRRPFNFSKNIEFKDVEFFYKLNDQKKWHLDLSLNKGKMAGIVGPSGSGKTTIVDLLLRLLTPQKGQILIDSVNINDMDLAKLRKNIGYVAQESFLFNDTIEANIRFYDREVTNDRIIEAAKIANIYDTIQNFPEGFQTLAGERGMKLSGGQRQRIALARALAKNPQILILDEATSAIDNESERLIQKSIQNLKGRMTILVIAHRQSTAMQADSLFVLKDGEIVEQGKPSDLLSNQDSYFAKISQN